MLRRQPKQPAAAVWPQQAETLSHPSPQIRWLCSATTRSLSNLPRIATAYVVIFLSLTSQALAEPPAAENLKDQNGRLQCAAQFELLSYGIELYLSDWNAQRQISPAEFAQELRFKFPIAGCDTDTVKRVLSRNRFFRVTLDDEYASGHITEIRLGNDQILFMILWSRKERAIIRDGIRGKRKRTPHDYRY
jgi:hypothetical protein